MIRTENSKYFMVVVCYWWAGTVTSIPGPRYATYLKQEHSNSPAPIMDTTEV